MKYYVKRYGLAGRRELTEIHDANGVGIEVEDGKRVELFFREEEGIELRSEDVLVLRPSVTNCVRVDVDLRGALGKSEVGGIDDPEGDNAAAREALRVLHNLANTVGAVADRTKRASDRKQVQSEIHSLIQTIRRAL